MAFPEKTEAIHALTVRGAPAIGIAAAWGVVLAAREVQADDGPQALQKLEPALQRLNASRPTAVNLAWALARMRRVLGAAGKNDEIRFEAMGITLSQALGRFGGLGHQRRWQRGPVGGAAIRRCSAGGTRDL